MALIGGSLALAKDILKADDDTHDPDPESGTPGHGSRAEGKKQPAAAGQVKDDSPEATG